jgi:hypothetical protein
LDGLIDRSKGDATDTVVKRTKNDLEHIKHKITYQAIKLYIGVIRKRTQEFLLAKLTSALRTFYGCNHDMVNRYGVSVSHMIRDIFHLS